MTKDGEGRVEEGKKEEANPASGSVAPATSLTSVVDDEDDADDNDDNAEDDVVVVGGDEAGGANESVNLFCTESKTASR